MTPLFGPTLAPIRWVSPDPHEVTGGSWEPARHLSKSWSAPRKLYGRPRRSARSAPQHSVATIGRLRRRSVGLPVACVLCCKWPRRRRTPLCGFCRTGYLFKTPFLLLRFESWLSLAPPGFKSKITLIWALGWCVKFRTRTIPTHVVKNSSTSKRHCIAS